jgi:hypothetical protein
LEIDAWDSPWEVHVGLFLAGIAVGAPSPPRKAERRFVIRFAAMAIQNANEQRTRDYIERD